MQLTMAQETPQADERILKRVKKALNLANSKNDAESHTAMLLAQEMMAKYGIDMGDVNAHLEEASQKEVMEMYATKPTKLQWWQKELAAVVADNFRCYTFQRTRSGKSRIVFLGLKEDTKIAREVFAYAQDAIEYFSILYLNEKGVEGISERSKIRNDYILGFISGLRDKFREQVDANGWGLILQKDADVVERHKQLKLKKDAGSSASMAGDYEAYQSGHTEGKRMDHTKKVLKG